MTYLYDFIIHLGLGKIILNIFGPDVDFGVPHPSFYQTAIKPHIKGKVSYE
jgi:hypothetical protein